jgi:hypothetical protein
MSRWIKDQLPGLNYERDPYGLPTTQTQTLVLI